MTEKSRSIGAALIFPLTNAACAVIVAGVVVGVQIRDLDHFTAVGGVDELAIADVNTDVGDASFVGAGEEHQVTGLQLAPSQTAHLTVSPHQIHGGRLETQ